MKQHGNNILVIPIILFNWYFISYSFNHDRKLLFSNFRYLFDAINALQGLWVFLIFVFRPDIKKRVMKTTGLDTVFTSGTKSRNIKVHMLLQYE